MKRLCSKPPLATSQAQGTMPLSSPWTKDSRDQKQTHFQKKKAFEHNQSKLHDHLGVTVLAARNFNLI